MKEAWFKGGKLKAKGSERSAGDSEPYQCDVTGISGSEAKRLVEVGSGLRAC